MKGIFIGTTTIDLIYPIEKYPDEDSKTNVTDHLVALGGPSTNAAIAFSALGGEATLISPVGDTPWTPYIKNRLAKYGVTHHDLSPGANFAPSISSILVNTSTGLRTVFTSPSRSSDLRFDFPKFNLTEYDVGCLDGFHADIVLEILKNKSDEIPIVFDGGSYKYRTDDLLMISDFPIFSERFTAPKHPHISDYMSDMGITTYAVTRGFNPIEIRDGDKSYNLTIPHVKAIDTLAAGDIFHGAFAYYIVSLKGNFKAAIEKSIEIASLSCQFLGPREWIKHLRNA